MELLRAFPITPCVQASNRAMGTSVFGEDAGAEERCMNVFCFNFLFLSLSLTFHRFPSRRSGWMMTWEKNAPLWPSSCSSGEPFTCTWTGSQEVQLPPTQWLGGRAAPRVGDGWPLCLHPPGGCSSFWPLSSAACHLTWPHWGPAKFLPISISWLHNALLCLLPRRPTLDTSTTGLWNY